MRLGISALLFNMDEALEICEEYNLINHIEVGIDNLKECKKLLAYEKKIKNLGLSIGIHLPMELNTCENIDYIRESWISFINKMKSELSLLPIEYFNLHLGYIMTDRLNNNRSKYLDNTIKFFNDENLNKDIVISIENTYSNDGDFSNLGNNAQDFEYIFSKIKRDNMYFCYDTGHYLINIDDYLGKFKEKIKLIHLSDNDGIKDIHIGIGKGILSNEHIKKVMDIDVDYLILEINYRDIESTLINLNMI